MTVKTDGIVASNHVKACEEDAQQEVASFLRALASYAERFEHEPKLSFEQYFLQIAAEQPKAVSAS